MTFRVHLLVEASASLYKNTCYDKTSGSSIVHQISGSCSCKIVLIKRSGTRIEADILKNRAAKYSTKTKPFTDVESSLTANHPVVI